MFVGINYREPLATITAFIQQTGFSHPVLMDQAGDVYTTYQLDGNASPFPLDYIIDRDGVIAYGATEYNPFGMQVILDLLLMRCDTVRQLTAYPENGQMTLKWPGYSAGEFLVFSAMQPDAVYPGGWTLEATIPATGPERVSFTDPAALSVRKFYTVIHRCP